MVNFRRFKKKVGKSTRRFRRAANKRYFRPKSGYFPNMQNIASDVKALKTLVNAEKHETIISNTTAQSVGQVTGNADGAFSLDITPTPALGDGPTARTGDSIKCVTAMFKFQFWQMASTTNPVKLKMTIVRVLGEPQSAGSPQARMLVTNPFVTGGTIKDYHSQPNVDYLSQYKVVARRTITIKPDPYSGAVSTTNVDIPLKLGRFGLHTQFSDGSTTVTNGQYVMYIVADNGNNSPSITSTLGNLVTSAINTGIWFNYNLKYYWYDN